MHRIDAWQMIKRRAQAIGLPEEKLIVKIQGTLTNDGILDIIPPREYYNLRGMVEVRWIGKSCLMRASPPGSTAWTRICGRPARPRRTAAGTWPESGRPQVDTLKGSKVANLKELRIQHRGEPWRVLFAFDPARTRDLAGRG